MNRRHLLHCYTHDKSIFTKINLGYMDEQYVKIQTFTKGDSIIQLIYADTVKLSKKDPAGRIVDEIVVSNYDETLSMLSMLGYTCTAYVEKLRDTYLYKRAKIHIDRYPGMPPIIEMEAASRALISTVARELELNPESEMPLNKLYYLIYGIQVDLSELTFGTAGKLYEFVARNHNGFCIILDWQLNRITHM